MYTPSNFGVCARQKALEKCFKMCHIFWNNETQIVFCLFFISSYFGFDTMDAALVYVDLHQGNKTKIPQNEKRFLIPKIWQILKHFSRAFCRAQTLKLLGVCTVLWSQNAILNQQFEFETDWAIDRYIHKNIMHTREVPLLYILQNVFLQRNALRILCLLLSIALLWSII